jgi:hypothetical protein
MSRLSFLIIAVVVLLVSVSSPRKALSAQSQPPQVEYRVLATTKTSTMEKELNEAAEAGFRFQAFMGGETAFGGDEVVAVLVRKDSGAQRFAYKLLATTKTSTMQQELQETADAGFEYRGQSVFSSFFGGDEVVLVLERDKDAEPLRFEYRLVATSKTATLQKELAAAALAGFELVGLTVSKTVVGGSELVAITRRPRAP